MSIEEEYTDVLQNIESVVARFYRKHPPMTDYAVLRTYEAVIDAYTAEKIDRQLRVRPRPGLEQELFEAVKMICEWRLGRAPSNSQGPGISEHPFEPIDIDTLLACLKRLRKSVQKWNKQSGRQGYLDFMSQFIK